MRMIRKLLREAHGAAAVEFALIAPLLFVLIFGIIDFGRALFTLNNLTSAVREGARFGAVQTERDATTTTAIRARVQSYVSTSAVGGAAPTVTVTYPGQSVRVAIASYPFVPITPIAGLVGLGSITMSPAAEFRWERATSP